MALKIFSGIVAVALVLAYLLPLAIKLKEPALAIVMFIGVVMMLVDLWQSRDEADS